MDQAFDFGLVGLGVMGRNFILNVADNEFSAIGLDTDPDKVASLIEEGSGKSVFATTEKEDFVAKLSTPRKIMMLVPAGAPVDSVIHDLLPLLSPGDILIDGGNSFFRDTDRREDELKQKGVHFFGAGVSGGAKGARLGPSIMPGGDKEAWRVIKPVFEAVSAKVKGEPCVDYMGNRSAGNYVKMVHNGIEYGLMQLISETYDILKRGLSMSNIELHRIFNDWNKGSLKSFLIEITAEIFTKEDDQSKYDVVDIILDKGKQKGTGKWTSQNALDLGVPIPTIDIAVSMRQLSSIKDTRIQAEKIYGRPNYKEKPPAADEVEKALYFAFLVTYAQGLSLLAVASKEYDYDLDLERVARIWRGGCIIRAGLLEDIRQAFDKKPELTNLLLDKEYSEKVKACRDKARKVLNFAVNSGLPAPGLASAVSYFDAFKTGRLPMNLVQAQRDHFGSHTYERVDKEGVFHTDWSTLD